MKSLIIGQSGGPTSVINGSLAGVYSEAKRLGLPEKSYLPQTLEEKIVAHADNLVSGSEEVDIDFVIEKWKRRIDEPEDNIKRLIELDNELIKAFEE